MKVTLDHEWQDHNHGTLKEECIWGNWRLRWERIIDLTLYQNQSNNHMRNLITSKEELY